MALKSERRYLELVAEEIESACKRYDPLKMQSSLTSLGFIRDKMIEEGTVRNAGEFFAVTKRMQIESRKVIKKVGDKHGFFFDTNSLCMYPK